MAVTLSSSSKDKGASEYQPEGVHVSRLSSLIPAIELCAQKAAP